MKDSIGGYFELELRKGLHFHKDALRLNSARNCFEYVLRARDYKRVYMPYYTCQVMFDIVKNLDIDVAYYRINESLEPVDLPELKDNEAFLYTNYYGLKQRCVELLAKKYGNRLIVDNAQAFYAKPLEGIDTFYSPRKFFGVPDGGYLYTEVRQDDDFTQAKSLERMSHLLKRIEDGAEVGYRDYQYNEQTLYGRPIERMSKLTEALLCSIDYETIKEKRINNYKALDELLYSTNLIKLTLEYEAVPMVYPYLTNDNTLRKRLIDNRIFVATYWTSIDDNNSYEFLLKNNLIPLPIDQRYDSVVLDQYRLLNI